MLLNGGTPPERQRFTLAHELGHMVMHQVPHPEQKKANRFAAELLMPTQEIRDQLHGQIDVPLLLELKAQWKVSMWALLRRAHTFGILGDWQYRSLAVEMSSVGYRTSEPRAVLRATAAVRGVAVRRRPAVWLRSGGRVQATGALQ